LTRRSGGLLREALGVKFAWIAAAMSFLHAWMSGRDNTLWIVAATPPGDPQEPTTIRDIAGARYLPRSPDVDIAVDYVPWQASEATSCVPIITEGLGKA
jgi:hypothetical protein